MHYLVNGASRPWRIAVPVLALLLLLAVACGAAAPAAPQEGQATGSSGPPPPAAAQNTATPTPAAQPAAASPGQGAEVHPGKVVIMIGSWGGRFTLQHATNCHNYDVNFHGYLIRSDQNRKLIPGIPQIGAFRKTAKLGP